MAAYLLGTQTVVALAQRAPGPVKQWADGLATSADQLYVSVISVGQIEAEIERIPAVDPRKRAWQSHFRAALRPFLPSNLIAVDQAIATRWASLLPLELQRTDARSGMQVAVAADSRLVLATALERGLILVDAIGQCHSVLIAHGLRCFDPYANTSIP